MALGHAPVAGAHTARAARVRWSRISGPTGASPQLGLGRSSNKALHVIWSRGPHPATISDTVISGKGKILSTGQVASGWDGGTGLALLTLPGGVFNLFATGGHAPGLPTPEVGINALSGQPGHGWTLDQGDVWGGSGVGDPIGATLSGSQPVTAWTAAGVADVKLGISPGDAGVEQVCVCSALSAGVATDGASGAVIAAGATIDNPAGTFVQQALPSLGARHVLPSATQTGHSGISFGIAGRSGRAGVYVIYTNAGRPGVIKPSVRLYRYGGGTRTLARGPYDSVAIAPGPGGHMWLFWGDAKGGIFVTRSNAAVTRFEPRQHLRLPPGTGSLLGLEGEGSAGPLDVFPDVVRSGNKDTGFWHARVLGRFSLKISVRRPHKGKAAVTVTALDAGDPVQRALVSLGGRRLKTDAKGHASFTLRTGSYKASAHAGGYVGTSLRFKVR